MLRRSMSMALLQDVSSLNLAVLRHRFFFARHRPGAANRARVPEKFCSAEQCGGKLFQGGVARQKRLNPNQVAARVRHFARLARGAGRKIGREPGVYVKN